jgi:hypothetical protein
MLLFGMANPATVSQRLEIPEGLTNYPVHFAGTNRQHVSCLQHTAERRRFVLTEGNVVCLTKCMNERTVKIVLNSAFQTHQHGVWLEGINLYMAINIHLWGSLKKSIAGLSVLSCTTDIIRCVALSPETQHSWHFEIKYALLQIFTRVEARNI